MDCPTKLFYTGKRKEYANQSLDDPFLKALAEGGFQVGELAKCYYPEGIEIEGLDNESIWARTQEELKKENVTLFEAAIKFKNFFVRIDILKKTGNVVELIEVKAKSIDSNTQNNLWQKSKKNQNKLNSKYTGYIYDVAFQAHVLKSAYPDFVVNSFLMCTNKDKLATVDGLNQKFLIKREGERKSTVVRIGDTSLAALGESILTKLDLNEAVFKIHQGLEETEVFGDMKFKEAAEFFADHYVRDEKIKPVVSKNCKGCEFQSDDGELKSGFKECWKECHSLKDKDFEKPFHFNVWRRPGSIPEERLFMEEIEMTDFTVKAGDGDGLSWSQRQWLQIEKVKNGDETEYKDQDGINRAFATYKYPLHFIDFETCMTPIPFNKGRKPYEQIAFQFSHHIMYEDGTYEHAGEWIEVTPGKFPNFDFVRALKKQLEKDSGTIFRYSNHENTVLNQIFEQLVDSDEPDKVDLMTFIKSITYDRDEDWIGPRNMVDLLDIVIKFYFHPSTGGSNSIKYVLPAILKAQGKEGNPYKDLPPVFDQYDRETLDLLMQDEDIQDGGAALIAYRLMQFSVMSDEERRKIKEALLRYCKLDTEAMVWLFQYLKGEK